MSSAPSTFQAALVNSSESASAENGSLGVGSKARSCASPTGPAASKPDSKRDKTQLPSSSKDESTSASAPVPPADPKTAPVQISQGGQETADRAGDRASESSPTTDLQFLTASPELSRQIAAQGVPSAAEPAATKLQASEVAASDKDADGAAQTVVNAEGSAAQAVAGVVAPSAGETFKLQMELPMAAVPANKADSAQAVGKPAQRNFADAAGSKSSDLTNAADTGKAKAADVVGAVGSASSHNTESNGQSMQHSQPDASQVAMAVQRVVDGGAAQAQVTPIHAAIHEVATTPDGPGRLQDAVHQDMARGDTASGPLDGDETTPTSGINAARLIQTMGETEMRVGMHSAEFGNISIRTSVSEQQMLAQISLDHSGLSQAISGHISSIQTKLGNDYGLQTLIQVNHQSASSTGEQGSSAQRERSAFAPLVRGESAGVPAELDVGINPGALASTGDGYRLDIRA